MAVFRDNTINPVEHDRSIEDRRRHRQLVEKSIKENIGDILSEESIVGETKNKKFKIPIRGIKEYQINNEKRYLIDTCLNSQDKYEKLVNYFLEEDN